MNAHFLPPNDPFATLWALGYRSLVPIAPPGATISRAIPTKLTPKGLGKAPAVRVEDGWIGYLEWQTIYPTEAQLERWRDWGAGVGIRCENGLLGIDADTLIEALATAIEAEVVGRLGPLPQRIGQAPKRMFFCRTDPEYRHPKLIFDEGIIEVRTNGQFVAYGEHPVTHRPYYWTQPPVALESLPYVTPATLDALWWSLKQRLPNCHFGSAGDGADVPPERLRGSVERVRAALKYVPNDYTDRKMYIDVLMAAKAAAPDDPEKVWEAVWTWCQGWKGGVNEEDVVRRDFDSLNPTKIGIGFLEDLANKRSRNQLTAERNHEELTEEESTPPSYFSQPATVFAGIPAPPQKWLANGLIPARTVTLLYGDGGTGKSLISLQLAFACASSGKWLDLEVSRGPALFVTAEDEAEEVHRRIVAVASGSGFTIDELKDLHWRSLAGQDAVLAAPDAKGLMKPTPLYGALKAEIVRLRPTLLVLDTLADLFGGDEIKRIQARQFIQLLQGLIVGLDFDLSVVLLGHPSVAGMNSGTGTSGSTAWSNSVRSRLYLERKLSKRGENLPPIEIDPDVRILSTKKANRTKQGGEIIVRWSAGRFVPQAAAPASRDPDADALDEKLFLDLLADFDRSERPVSPNVTSPTYAPKLFLSHPKADDIGKVRLEGAMSRLFTQGTILVQTYGPASKSYKRISRRESDLFG